MRITICLLAVLLLVACSTTVRLTVKNPTEILQTPKVVILSDKNIEKETINLGTLVPKGETERSMKVKHSWNIVVKSNTDRGYGAWESAPYTILKEPDPLKIDVELGFNGNFIANDSKAIEQIRDALRDLGPNVGFRPIPVKNALSSLFGSLVVLIPPSKQQSQQFLYLVEASRFSKSVTTLDQFIYPESDSHDEVKVIGKNSTNLAASVPVYGSIGVNVSVDNLYNVKWNMNKYGSVLKTQPAEWSIVGAIMALSDDEKNAIEKVMKGNPSAVMIYLNQLYVIKNADFFVTESKKLDTKAKLTAASFVTADGAWTFENTHESHHQFQDLVLNVAGITLPLSIMKKPSQTKGLLTTYSYQVVVRPEMEQKKYFLPKLTARTE